MVSTTPPGTVAKNAVLRSTPVSRMKISPPIAPSSVETKAAPIISGKSVTSLANTDALNCKPVEAPTTMVPAARPHGISRIGTPASDSAMMVNSEPSSHGSGSARGVP